MNANAATTTQVPTQYLTFMLGNDAYTIGILSIKEIIEYTSTTEVPLMPSCVRGVINLRGAVVPVMDLQVRFGQTTSAVTKRTCIVIVEVHGPQGQQVMGVVVDDSPVQRAYAVSLCRQLGIELIYEACHGVEALQQLDMLQLKPDLMLIDLHMPVMDGVELITHLHEKGLKIPMLVVSSQQVSILNAVQDLSSTLGMPMLGSLHKPMRLEQLEAALQHYSQCKYGNVLPSSKKVPIPVTSADLCNAIDTDQLQVHYQPKVDIPTGLVRGMEVLARWHHPTLGPIPPDQFVALAEKEQLIFDLTMQVLRKAIGQAATWQQTGFYPRLAINLSPLLLDSPCIVPAICDMVTSHGIQPSQVVLEITESAGVQHLGRVIAVLTRLRLHGFDLSIDDYGTGFSSMQQLARLPFTELKIDRSFVHGAHQRRNLGVILESAMDMAKRLELVSVAARAATRTSDITHVHSDFLALL